MVKYNITFMSKGHQECFTFDDYQSALFFYQQLIESFDNVHFYEVTTKELKF